ncbi:Uncharacterized protein YfhR [Symbiodinium microadriaticum]|uniref:Uncharacterized protein YfhR n=1 Tax=Symbiodinium microadriaticum TaxID=2951 RepID=A0A1Q9CUM5_SYMMI|nr:Uncharacterized protein YfhR [Symbiodinium microadriaticum]
MMPMTMQDERAVPPYAARGAAGAAVGAGMGILGVAGYVVSAVHRSRRRGYTDEFVLTPEDLNMPYEEVQFFTEVRYLHDSEEDGISLTGWFIPQSSAGRPSRRILVFCHPYNNSKSNLLGVARGLWDRRYSIFMFDFRSFADAKTSQSVGYLEQRDAKAAVAAARRHGPKDAEIGLIGASMGGAVALIIGHGEDVGAVGVATDCAFARLSDVLLSRNIRPTEFPQPLAAFTVDLASHLNPLLHGYSFKAVSPVDAVEHGPRAGQVPLLLIHADNDEVVTVSQAHAIHSAALAPKEPGRVEVRIVRELPNLVKSSWSSWEFPMPWKLVADFFDSAFAAAERRRTGEGLRSFPALAKIIAAAKFFQLRKGPPATGLASASQAQLLAAQPAPAAQAGPALLVPLAPRCHSNFCAVAASLRGAGRES